MTTLSPKLHEAFTYYKKAKYSLIKGQYDEMRSFLGKSLSYSTELPFYYLVLAYEVTLKNDEMSPFVSLQVAGFLKEFEKLAPKLSNATFQFLNTQKSPLEFLVFSERLEHYWILDSILIELGGEQLQLSKNLDDGFHLIGGFRAISQNQFSIAETHFNMIAEDSTHYKLGVLGRLACEERLSESSLDEAQKDILHSNGALEALSTLYPNFFEGDNGLEFLGPLMLNALTTESKSSESLNNIVASNGKLAVECKHVSKLNTETGRQFAIIRCKNIENGLVVDSLEGWIEVEPSENVKVGNKFDVACQGARVRENQVTDDETGEVSIFNWIEFDR